MIKNSLNIQQKIQIYILLSVALVFLVVVSFLGFNSRSHMLKMSEDLAITYAQEYANSTSERINYYAITGFNLQTLFQNYDLIPQTARRSVLSGYLKNTLLDNPSFLSVWSILESNAIDTLSQMYKDQEGSTAHGNFRYVYFRENDKVVLSTNLQQKADKELMETIYALVKQRLKPTIVDPYHYSYTGNKVDEVLETNIVMPLISNERFLGVVGIDVPLESISKQMVGYSPVDGSFVFLLSHSGYLVSFPEENLVGKNIREIGFLSNADLLLEERLSEDKPFTYMTEFNHEQYYVASAPVSILGTGMVWHVQLALPLSFVHEMAAQTLQTAILVGFIGLALLFVVIMLVAKSIVIPIRKFTQIIEQISEGSVNKELLVNVHSTDEIGQMGIALNKYILGYAEKTEFASKIGDGKLNAEFDLLSEDDVLGQSLMQMRDNLAKAKNEEDVRREEDQKHRWTNEGIALFADILRQNNDNVKKLSYELMRKLVNYLNVHQGAIFVLDESELDDEDVFYEATATIAFDRRQFNKTRVKLGEDLIGRCAHERKTIYLKDVPDDYVTINSGLGEARPSVVIIVPAVLNDKVYAIIEMASFNELDTHKIQFVEKLSESVASTIANVKVSERTQLLLEESQHQREELSAQEEEMRQNLEELQTTQEEAARREFELRGLIEALSVSNYMVEYDLHGVITDVNERFSGLVGLPRTQIIGMNHKEGLDLTGLSTQKYNQFWEDLRHGIGRTEETHISYNDKSLFLFETYTPLSNNDEEVYKIVKISIDITDLRKAQLDLKKALADLDLSRSEIDQLQRQLADITERLNEEISKVGEIEHKMAQMNESVNKSHNYAKNEDGKVDLPLPAAGEPLIAWTDTMTNKVIELNEQHKRIVLMVDQLYVGLRTDKPKKEIKELLKMLVDYTSWHFSNEERYFEQFGFEFSNKHCADHKEFVSHLNDFRKKYQAGRIKFYDDVMRYIKNWIEDHFANADRKYETLFLKNGIE